MLPGHRRVEFVALTDCVYRNKEFLKENVVVLGIFQEDLLIICLFLFNVW